MISSAFPRAPRSAHDPSEIAQWSFGIGWDVAYQQVSRGAFSGVFVGSTRTGLVMHDHYAEQSVIISGSAPKHMFAVAVSEVTLTPPVFQGVKLTASQVITMYPGSDAVLRSPERTGVSSVSIPSDRLDKALHALSDRGLSDIAKGARPREVSPARAHAIRSLIKRSISTIESDLEEMTRTARVHLLEDRLIQTVAAGWEVLHQMSRRGHRGIGCCMCAAPAIISTPTFAKVLLWSRWPARRESACALSNMPLEKPCRWDSMNTSKTNASTPRGETC